MKIKYWSTPEGYTPKQRGFHFWCPGCEEYHSIRIEGPTFWGFDGNDEKPTVSPSILVTGHDGRRCHSYLTNGVLNFLDDCTHKLRGRVPLPDYPKEDV